MIRLMIAKWSKDQKVLLRDCLFYAYWKAIEIGGRDTLIITKAFANAISWLEDDIAKM